MSLGLNIVRMGLAMGLALAMVESPARAQEVQQAPNNTPTAPEATPTAPEATPTAPEATPTAPEATPTAPEATPTAPEATPTAPEAIPTALKATPMAPEATSTALKATPTAPEATPAPPDPTMETLRRIMEHFQFGSYGRVPLGSDLTGGTAKQVRLIAHPPRLIEGPYAELDFAYTHDIQPSGPTFQTQITLAFGEKLFHFTGDFEADIALRNLYLEVRDVFTKGLQFWAGSRMYRGDDIYLLDFWPLDEQNTVGGGAAYFFSTANIRLHAGMNRLEDSFQTQYIEVPNLDFGSREVLFMDRMRAVVTLRGENNFALGQDLRLKGVLYGEAQILPSGTRETDDQREEALPSDYGFLGGLELSLYGFGDSNHVNLFARYATGLTAYDEMGIPFGLDTEKRSAGARELLLGLSANFEVGGIMGLLVGSYGRYFVDADPNVYDRDDAWEVGAAVRPAFYIHEHFHLIGEANVQYLRPNGLSPQSGQLETPLAFEFGIMPTLSLGKGSYSRPQLRLVYAMTFLNDAALATFAADDPQRDRPIRYFLGANVEWWFHSSRY